jgi:hypothetical protein
MTPYQKWCGQTQPHNPHEWADIRSDSLGLKLACAGYKSDVELKAYYDSGFEAGKKYATGLVQQMLEQGPQETHVEASEPIHHPRPRLRSCVEEWPECYEGGYNPKCYRFPKSCSCTAYPDNTAPEELEAVDKEN